MYVCMYVHVDLLLILYSKHHSTQILDVHLHAMHGSRARWPTIMHQSPGSRAAWRNVMADAGAMSRTRGPERLRRDLLEVMYPVPAGRRQPRYLSRQSRDSRWVGFLWRPRCTHHPRELLHDEKDGKASQGELAICHEIESFTGTDRGLLEATRNEQRVKTCHGSGGESWGVFKVI